MVTWLVGDSISALAAVIKLFQTVAQGLGARVIQPVLPSVPWRHTEVSNVRVTTAPKQQLSSSSVLPGFLEGALGANVESLDVSCRHVAPATTPVSPAALRPRSAIGSLLPPWPCGPPPALRS